MKINEKTIRLRIDPYVKEATFQLVLDVILMASISTILAIAGLSFLACIAIVAGYFAIALLFHYKVAIQAILDKRKGDYITETIKIIQFADEYSFAGDRSGHSKIHLFYPEEMSVGKYKIKVSCHDGTEKKLRAVMSAQRLQRLLAFAVWQNPPVEHLQVTYLKRSKILIHVDLTEETDQKTAKRKREALQKEALQKTLCRINMSI